MKSIQPPVPDGPCPDCGGEQASTRAAGECAEAVACSCVMQCTLCSGRRFRFERNERGYEVAMPCQCQRVLERVSRFNEASIPARYHAATIDDFEERSAQQRALKYELLDIRDQFDPGDSGYVVWGPPGTGKTHLLAALMAYFTRERGIRCKFIDFGYLTTLIKQGYSAGKAENEIIDGLVGIPVLTVDELGKGRGSEWELTVLDALVNRRYNAGLSTFFTTNFAAVQSQATRSPGAHAAGRGTSRRGAQAVSGLVTRAADRGRLGGGDSMADTLRTHPGLVALEDRVGSRIYSRLHEMCHFRELDGEDMRRRADANRS